MGNKKRILQLRRRARKMVLAMAVIMMGTIIFACLCLIYYEYRTAEYKISTLLPVGLSMLGILAANYDLGRYIGELYRDINRIWR